MISILSPTKSLNSDKQNIINTHTQPLFIKEAKEIAKACKKLAPYEMQELMKISNKLLDINYIRFQEWGFPFTIDNAKQAIFSYSGEVFNGLDAHSLSDKQILFAQDHVNILSGLHGVLKPLDLIQSYRLEMLTKLQVGDFNNLYKYWGDKLSNYINDVLEKHKNKHLINLASNEYSKAVCLKNINYPVITPVFKELKGDEFKVVTMYAKKARGLMLRFIIENEIDTPEKLILFDADGYYYNENLSTESELVFVR